MAAAERIGYPVAIKPLDGNHGRGVMLNLADAAAVRAAYPAARAESRYGGVVVESYLIGNDYRCLVVGGVLRAVAQRIPAHVDGDGKHTVAELVEITNADPRRGHRSREGADPDRRRRRVGELRRGPGTTRSTTCRRQGHPRLPEADREHEHRRDQHRSDRGDPPRERGDRRAGGQAWSGSTSPGIDFVCPDISVPVRETGGGIVEVNAAPGFRMHTNPTEGEAQYVAKPVIDMLFPPGTPVAHPDRGGDRHATARRPPRG